MTNRPKVGVTVFVCSPLHPHSVLLGVRRSSLGDGLYAPPGGHLEFGESFEDCARREVLEETGLELVDVCYETIINEIWLEEDHHYIDIVMKAQVDLNYKPEPENLEPHKCDGWYWFDWDKLPPVEQRFKPLQMIIEQGYSPVP